MNLFINQKICPEAFLLHHSQYNNHYLAVFIPLYLTEKRESKSCHKHERVFSENRYKYIKLFRIVSKFLIILLENILNILEIKCICHKDGRFMGIANESVHMVVGNLMEIYVGKLDLRSFVIDI